MMIQYTITTMPKVMTTLLNSLTSALSTIVDFDLGQKSFCPNSRKQTTFKSTRMQRNFMYIQAILNTINIFNLHIHSQWCLSLVGTFQGDSCSVIFIRCGESYVHHDEIRQNSNNLNPDSSSKKILILSVCPQVETS